MQTTFLKHFDFRKNIRLFCFPYAGGGARFFEPFTSFLAPEIELISIHLPARDERLFEKPYIRIDNLVEVLMNEIQFYLDTPFAFWGHCVGAIIAFELSVEINKRLSVTPDILFVSGCPAPHTIKVEQPYHKKNNEEFIDSIRTLNAFSKDYLPEDDALQILLPGLRADFAMYETYKYIGNKKLICPIVAFGSKDDTRVDELSIQKWEKCTSNSFEYYSFSGNHFFISGFYNKISEIIKAAMLGEQC